MGFFDYVSDLYSALAVTEVEAEEQRSQISHDNAGIADESGKQSDGQDTNKGGMGNAQHRGGGVTGGASSNSPASGSNEESDEEKEANAADAEKANSRTASSGGDAKVSRGENAAPEADDEEKGEEAEEEEEDDDEPKDPKPQLEAECLATQCHGVKHHYDECAERVQKQIDDNGKPEEDCIEEYFHMMHCATQCSAGKLFKALR